MLLSPDIYIIQDFLIIVKGFLKIFLNIFSDILDIILFILYITTGGDTMTVSQKIKMALAFKNMSEAELARQINTSPSAFNQRMKTGKFTSEELEKIAAALGAVYSFSFRFPDGTEI